MQDVLRAGARGYMLKSDAGRDLFLAIEAVQQGKTFFICKVGETVLQTFNNKGEKARTAREREILQLPAQGNNTRAAAIKLNASHKTVETHHANIMRKLKLHSVSELALHAIRNGYIVIGENTDHDPPKAVEATAGK